MSKKSLSNSNPATYITQVKEGSVISGNMRSPYSIRVDGFVTGDLVSQEKIIIGELGEIGGNLSGTDITLQGFVSGDVIAHGHLSITAKAHVYGKIFAKTISIETGAELNGKVNVGIEIDIPEFNESSPSRSTTKTIAHPEINDNSKDSYGNLAW